MLSARKDLEVTAYCRTTYADGAVIPESYRGIRLKVTPTIKSKHLDAIVHSFTSTVHAMASGADVIPQRSSMSFGTEACSVCAFKTNPFFA